jgi:hypothetical protein
MVRDSGQNRSKEIGLSGRRGRAHHGAWKRPQGVQVGRCSLVVVSVGTLGRE